LEISDRLERTTRVETWIAASSFCIVGSGEDFLRDRRQEFALSRMAAREDRDDQLSTILSFDIRGVVARHARPSGFAPELIFLP
jgi:hypothetical protein